MRILIATPFFLNAKAGISFHTKGLSRHLVQRGHEVIVITPYTRNIRVVVDGVTVIGVKSFYPPRWPFSWARTFSVPYFPLSLISVLRELVHEYNFDLLHAHGQKYLITWISVDLAFRMKIPVILEIHGTDQLRYSGAFATAMDEIVNRIMFRETVRKASAVLCHTKTDIQYWSKYCKGVKFFKYTQGIDVSRFTNALRHREKFREEFGIPLEKKVVLFLGRLEPVKGVVELLEAVESVTRKFGDSVFVIVGRGPLMSHVRRYAEAHKGKVMVIPWVPQVEKIYALSDVFVLPTKSESIGLVRLEAMASQRYIVTTTVGGALETLAGYPRKTYIEICTAPEISNALSQALETVSKMKVMDPRIQSYVQKFDWSNSIAEIERVYERIVERKA